MKIQTCPCCSQNLFSECCEPFIIGTKNPSTALALMRSRYTAYVLHDADYLIKTTHVSERKHYSKIEILDWAKNNNWQKLEIINATETTVEFKAYFLDQNSNGIIHHEFSNFKLENDNWFYVDGRFYS
jgi:SEC-C motif domain protein